MDNFSITQYGKPLNKSKYSIDLDTKAFSTKEDNLVLDFDDLADWTFKTGSDCTFTTGAYCTFNTGSNCTFNTGSDCTFTTGAYCTFTTGSHCTFKTGEDCTFTTAYSCTFTTGSHCTFMLYDINTCKFKTYDDISIILDRNDSKHYVLTKELMYMLKVKNG